MMDERAATPPSRKTRRPVPIAPLAANALLAFGGLAVAALTLVGAELLARRLAPSYLVDTRGLHVFSAAYGWAGRPGAVAPMGDGRVSLNRRGYRGRELPRPKAGERTRVVVLGDSVAFGFGVSDEQTFPHLLDVRDNGIEAANLAVAGYGPGQELLVLRREVLGEDPDVVVLAVCLRNDFVDAVLPVALYDGVRPRPVFRLAGDGVVLDDRGVRRSGPGRAVQWLSDYSQLFNRASAMVPRREVMPAHDWRYRKQEALRDGDNAVRLTLALVMEMDAYCRRRGIDFLVASFPSGLAYDLKAERPRQFLESLGARGVWVVDMSTHFRALGLTPTEIALDRTGHLSPRGHALTSEILESEIASRRKGPGRHAACANPTVPLAGNRCGELVIP